MRIALYGCRGECRQLEDLLVGCVALTDRKLAFTVWEDYDAFIHGYGSADALFVLADGGEGLECLNAAATIAPNTPRVWFSSDPKLGPQAIRMDVAFFAPKPITEELLLQALHLCRIGTNYFCGENPSGETAASRNGQR